MPVSTALPATLKGITATKIAEVAKQRSDYETSKRHTIENADYQTDLLSKVKALVDGTCRIEGYPVSTDDPSGLEDQQLSESLRNKRRFLRQAQADPSFSPAILRQFGDELSRDLELKSQGHIHAEFFSKLVTEWLSDSDEADLGITENSDELASSTSSFENVGRKEMYEQRAQWESLVFTRSDIDPDVINDYLTKLFTSTKTKAKALGDIRTQVRAFSAGFETHSGRFDSDYLKVTIKGLALTDLLSEEKNAVLKTFMSNKEVLSEICDVLNMRLMSLSTWSWSTDEGDALPLEMRKQLNGKYRVFMDEDVLDALLLHGIALRWAVEFKNIFIKFFRSRAWRRSDRTMPKLDKERREYFLGEETQRSSGSNVQEKRRDQYSEDYFMTQLPEDISEGGRTYEGDSDDEADRTRKSPLEIKHSLLHLLITESQLATRLRGDITVVRSDFKWFGPSLPHSTIFAVLRFFGMGGTWIDFFTRFLEAPLRFTQDGPQGAVRTRVRGVPMSHALSDLLGEVVLFCMDYAVNQTTHGSILYRLHDDFWFWGQEDDCRMAWRAMSQFASIMGIQFNEEKTGTVRLGSRANQAAASDEGVVKGKSEDNLESGSEDDSKSRRTGAGAVSMTDNLPKGEVRWGFLRLDSQTGRFLIDQSQVDDHIKELKLQLSHCNSIFSWIQAYNAYLGRFFSNNFGKPSFAFGHAHIDMMIETFGRIQRALFPNGSVTDHLRQTIEERFGVKDLPDGFFYFPVRMGGLELRNPLIPLFSMRDSIRRSPEKMLERALDKDEEEYHIAKERFVKNDTGAGLGRHSNFELQRKIRAQQGENDKFMPMEEFLRYREEKSRNLAAVYAELLAIPQEKEIDRTPQIASWLEALPVETMADKRNGRGSKRLGLGIYRKWSSMQPYWKWILAVHGAEVVQKYGSVRLVDEAKVPVGVVSVMKEGRVRWRG